MQQTSRHQTGQTQKYSGLNSGVILLGEPLLLLLLTPADDASPASLPLYEREWNAEIDLITYTYGHHHRERKTTKGPKQRGREKDDRDYSDPSSFVTLHCSCFLLNWNSPPLLRCPSIVWLKIRHALPAFAISLHSFHHTVQYSRPSLHIREELKA